MLGTILLIVLILLLIGALPNWGHAAYVVICAAWLIPHELPAGEYGDHRNRRCDDRSDHSDCGDLICSLSRNGTAPR